MARPAEEVATAPVDRAIERVRAVYRGWNRDTTVAQMRSDWDAAFGNCAVPVSCERAFAGGCDGEWIVPAHAAPDRAILYFHGGGFRIGSVTSHRDLIARIAEDVGYPDPAYFTRIFTKSIGLAPSAFRRQQKT